ncbi:MAG: hypothetical protein BWY70_01943 [Bacteroidetes bacterium ADurb.Bin408]|nr:MAG: hypothetical protein BWY70_01943 [Bacteroidetes bacterium ADurb.Bin408]
MPTFQATGIKLKLLAALYTGRFCVVNKPMVVNTGLEDMCIVADEPALMKEKLKELFTYPFTMQHIVNRQNVLNRNGFTNASNTKLLLELIYNSSGC